MWLPPLSAPNSSNLHTRCALPVFSVAAILTPSADHFGTYVNFWPLSAAAAIAPPIGFTKTVTPSTNWVLVAVPSFTMTADALAPKLN